MLGTNGLAALACFVLAPAVMDGQTMTFPYNFQGGTDGGLPSGGLTYVAGSNGGDGMLYGTTTGLGTSAPGGTIFSLDIVTHAFTTLYTFQGGADGSTPTGSLTLVGSIFYGTSSGGGPFVNDCYKAGNGGCGTVFSFDPATNKKTILYSFKGNKSPADPYYSQGGGLVYQNGILYGTTQDIPHSRLCGSIFGLNVTTGALVESPFGGNNCAILESGLTLFGNAFYGVGGSDMYSRTFSYAIGGKIKILSYQQANVGAYAMTAQGNYLFGSGAAFNPKKGKKGTDISYAALNAGPATPVGTTIYGFTSGANGYGGIGAFDITSGVTADLYDFKGSDGAQPTGGAIMVNGALYGVTFTGGNPACTYGGAIGCGVIYMLKP